MNNFKKIAFELPINGLSFGQTSTLILRSLFEREVISGQEYDIFLFPIGPVDFKSQQPHELFQNWLKSKIVNGIQNYTRDIPIFKLWHLNGSITSYTNKKQNLLTFYECDEPTSAEINVVKNNNVYFSSKYSCEVFKNAGLESKYLPLGFDSYNFKTLNKKFHNDSRIVFNLCGKAELRKFHNKIIPAWVKKYGGNPRFVLQCAIYNPFFNEQQNQQFIGSIFQGQQKPFNVNFFPIMNENIVYNEFLNSSDIIIGLSGAEGFGLPEFQSIALGKHGILLKAHSYQDWATDDMVTWVNPVGKEPIYDNMFFRQGEPFNQGSKFTWNEDEFISACETTIQKVEKNRINTAGLTLQETYSKEKFLDNILATF